MAAHGALFLHRGVRRPIHKHAWSLDPSFLRTSLSLALRVSLLLTPAVSFGRARPPLSQVRPDNADAARGLDECIATFSDLQSSLCKRKVVAATYQSQLGTEWMEDHRKCFYGEYTQGWLGFWTSPEVLRYGMFWANYHAGIYQSRWTEQQFFLHALALFGRVDNGALIDVKYRYDRGVFHRCSGRCAPMYMKTSNKGSAPC